MYPNYNVTTFTKIVKREQSFIETTKTGVIMLGMFATNHILRIIAKLGNEMIFNYKLHWKDVRKSISLLKPLKHHFLFNFILNIIYRKGSPKSRLVF